MVCACVHVCSSFKLVLLATCLAVSMVCVGECACVCVCAAMYVGLFCFVWHGVVSIAVLFWLTIVKSTIVFCELK